MSDHISSYFDLVMNFMLTLLYDFKNLVILNRVQLNHVWEMTDHFLPTVNEVDQTVITCHYSGESHALDLAAAAEDGNALETVDEKSRFEKLAQVGKV